jgi:hypothetical protein
VGGLLRFAFAAAPISAAFASWVDGKMGRAVVGRTGGAVGANKYIDVRGAFTAKRDDGLGVFSAVALRHEVMVCSTLTRLSMAAASRRGAGARARRQPHGFAWLHALDARTTGAGTAGEFLWRPVTAGATPATQDQLDATKEILAELDLCIRDDRARPLPGDRRSWDIPVDEVLSAAMPPAPSAVGAPPPDPARRRVAWIQSWLKYNTSRSRIPRRFVSSLVGPCGRRLLSREALFPHHEAPDWFLAIERCLLADVSTRAMLPAWHVGTPAGARPCAESRASERRADPRAGAGSAIFVSAAPDLFDGRQSSGGYTEPPTHQRRWPAAGAAAIVSYESTSDGTGVAPGGFALTVTLDSEGGLAPDGVSQLRDLCEVGWTAAPPRPDRAELAGLIRQLQVAPDRPGARLTSDCLAMLLLVQWATTAPVGRLMQHEHRCLLLEWRAVLRDRAFPPALGWIRGHASRLDWPFPAQAACDAAAAKVGSRLPADEAWRREVPKDESLFVLWDARTDRPILGGWAAAIASRSAERARAAAIASTRSGGGAWLEAKLLGSSFLGEWQRRGLAGKAGPAERARAGAQADTLWGPGTRCRWTIEQPAIRQGSIELLERPCTLCGAGYRDKWHLHILECAATQPAWDRVDAVAATEWAALAAQDFGEAEQVMVDVGHLWQRWRSGETIAGFSLVQHAVGPAAPDVHGVLGADDGTPTVYAIEDVAHLSRAFKEVQQALREAQGKAPPSTAHLPQSGFVLQHSSGQHCLAIKVMELWRGWAQQRGLDLRSPTVEFGSATARTLQRETERAAVVPDDRTRRAKHDFWCLWGGFTAWARRHFGGAITELFTGLLNRTGPWAHVFTYDEEDEVWGAAFDAWLREGGEERIWGEDRPAGEWQIGNPPYSAAEVLRFCRYARAALRPVMGIVPRFSGSGKDRVDNMAVARAHQGEVCAHFDSGTLAFVPFGVWAGLETRGDHAHRRAQMEVIIVTWAAPPLSVAARAELEAMVATTGVKGAWPLLHTEHPWNLQPPRMITALPLEGARTAFVTAAEALRLAAADTSMDPVEADDDSPSADAGQAPPPPSPACRPSCWAHGGACGGGRTGRWAPRRQACTRGWCPLGAARWPGATFRMPSWSCAWPAA